MSTASFEPYRSGTLVTLSPNSCLVAAVHNGIRLNVWTSSTKPSSSSATTGVRKPHSDSHNVCGLVSSWKPLDVVEQLVWAPDSSMIAVLEPHRHAIEVFSAYGAADASTASSASSSSASPIVRIDTGLNGASAIAWHPSSRALYWFGLAGSFMVSLVDGDVMRLVEESSDGVKLVSSFPRNVRPPEVLYALRPDFRPVAPSMLNNRGAAAAAATQARYSVAEKASTLRVAPRSPLLAHSPCGRWMFAITPRTCHALLSEQEQRDLAAASVTQPLGLLATNLTNRIQDSTTAVPYKPQAASHLHDDPDDLNIEEHLVIVDTATFTTRIRVPVAPRAIRSVTALFPLLVGHFLLYDEVSRRACLIRVPSLNSSDPTATTELQWSDVQSVAVSPSMNSVVIVLGGWASLATLLLVEGKYRKMLPISLALSGDRLRNEVTAALQEEEEVLHRPRATPDMILPGGGMIEDERAKAEDEQFTPSRYTPMLHSHDVFSRDLHVTAQSVRMSGLDAVAGVITMSENGCYVALSPPWDTQLVLVLHLLRRTIHTVLRHVDPVTSLTFSSAPTRGIPLAAVDIASSRSRDAVATASSSRQPRLPELLTAPSTQLCITTATHRGRVFLWSEDTASVLSVPTDELRRKSSSSSGKGPSSAPTSSRRPIAEGVPLPFYCSTALWGADSRSIVLADDFTGNFTVATLGS